MAPSEATLTYQHKIDPESSLSTTVVEIVSEVLDVSYEDLPPLSEVVDPEALDDLFRPQLDGVSRSRGELAFVYADHEVIVDPETVVVLPMPPKASK